MAEGGGGGYDIGASLSGSASSGASLSGATDFSGGGNFGGQSFGPGGVLFGAAATTPAQKYLIWVAVIAGVVILATIVIPLLMKGRR